MRLLHRSRSAVANLSFDYRFDLHEASAQDEGSFMELVSALVGQASLQSLFELVPMPAWV